MTEKERFKKVISHEKVDRPPCISPGGMMNMITTDLMDICRIGWPEAHLNSEMMANLALASFENNCFDNVGVPFCMTIEAEALGAKVTMGNRIFEPHVIEYAIDSVEQWKSLKKLDCNSGRAKIVLDAIKILKCDKNEKKVKIGENYYDLLHCNKVYFKESKGGVQVVTAAKKNSKDKKFSDAVKAFESYRKFSGDEEKKVKKLKDLAEAGIIPKETIKNIMKKFFEYSAKENNFQNLHKLLDFLYDEIPDMYKETKKKKIDTTTGKLEVILSEYLI